VAFAVDGPVVQDVNAAPRSNTFTRPVNLEMSLA
jgi:hypothetical protein